MELNEVQQVFFERLKLLMVSSNTTMNIAKAKEIFNNTVNAAQSTNERAFIQESLSPILQEFIRHLTEDAPEQPTRSDAEALVRDDGIIDSNSNLTGFVNVRDERGNVRRQQIDVGEELDIISSSVGAAMKNFNKEYHDDDMDPELAEYIKLHGRK